MALKVRQPFGSTRTTSETTRQHERPPALARSLVRTRIIARPPLSGLPASSYTPTVKHIIVRPTSFRTKLDRTREARIVRPPAVTPVVVAVKTLIPVIVLASRVALTARATDRRAARVATKRPLVAGRVKTLVKIRRRPIHFHLRDLVIARAPRRPLGAEGGTQPIVRITRRQLDARALLRALVLAHGARRPLGSDGTQPVVKITRRSTLTRGLLRSFALARPSRTGLPASAYTRTTTAIIVKATQRSRVLRDLDVRIRLARPSFKQPTTPTFKTIGAVFVRRTMRSRQLRDLDVRVRLAKPSFRALSQEKFRTISTVLVRKRRPLVRALDRKFVVTQPRARRLLFKRAAPLVRAQRRSTLSKAFSRDLVITRTNTRATPSLRVRKPYRSARRTIARPRALVIVRSRVFDVAAIVYVVTGFFRRGRPGGPDPGTPTAVTFDNATPGGPDPGTPEAGIFDTGTPGQE